MSGRTRRFPMFPASQPPRPLTNIEALELDYLPPHLIVLGGGYVGLELAQAYRRFGSRVTVIEHGPQLMGREDRDVADEIQRILERRRNRVPLERRDDRGAGADPERESASSCARTPASRPSRAATFWSRRGVRRTRPAIGLEEAGVELDGRGYIRVNERLETSAPDVWAIGECAGSPQFTHVSEDDFRIIRDNLAGGRAQHARPAGSLLHVHRPSARPCGTERGRGATPRRGSARREDTDELQCCGRRRSARRRAS